MPIINHSNPNAYEVCWIYGIASYFLIDQSVLNWIKNENSDFVFLNLHKVNNNTVSKNLKDILQQNLPKDLLEEIVKKYTSKS